MNFFKEHGEMQYNKNSKVLDDVDENGSQNSATDSGDDEEDYDEEADEDEEGESREISDDYDERRGSY